MNSKNAVNYENVVIRKEKEVGINNFGLDYLVSLEQEIERLKEVFNTIRKALELSESQKKLSQKYISIGRERYDKILDLLDKEINK